MGTLVLQPNFVQLSENCLSKVKEAPTTVTLRLPKHRSQLGIEPSDTLACGNSFDDIKHDVMHLCCLRWTPPR